MDNYKQTLELIKINETTGRIPQVQNRRLSTSVSNNHIRPRSSYSLANHQFLENTQNDASVGGGVPSSARNSIGTTVAEPLLQIRQEIVENKGW